MVQLFHSLPQLLGNSALQQGILQRRSGNDYMGKQLCGNQSFSKLLWTMHYLWTNKGDGGAFCMEVCMLAPACSTKFDVNAADSGMDTQQFPGGTPPDLCRLHVVMGLQLDLMISESLRLGKTSVIL